jgi:hypothetical protein
MQVENVELIQRQVVNEALDLGRLEKVPAHIEHGAAPGEAGAIADGDGFDLPGAGLGGLHFDGGGQELAQGLDAMEQAGRVRG